MTESPGTKRVRSNQEFLLPVAFVAAVGAPSQFCRADTQRRSVEAVEFQGR